MEIRLVPVVRRDVWFIFDLRNNPKIREKMLITRKLTWEEHVNYWEKRLLDKRATSYIVVHNRKKIGLIRLDKRKYSHEVGILILPKMQNKGIGTVCMKKVIEIAKHKNIKKLDARVRLDNYNSQKLFLKNGFNPRYVMFERCS